MNSKERLKIVAVTSLAWTICLSGCAALQIKTWFNDGLERHELVRKNPDGTIKETKSYVDADGYLCYSPEDDKAWRNRLAVCCADNK